MELFFLSIARRIKLILRPDDIENTHTHTQVDPIAPDKMEMKKAIFFG